MHLSFTSKFLTLLVSITFIFISNVSATPGFTDVLNKVTPDKEASIVAGTHYRLQYPITDGRYDVNMMFTKNSIQTNAMSEKSRKFIYVIDDSTKTAYLHWKTQPKYEYGYFQDGGIFKIHELHSDDEVLAKAQALGKVKAAQAQEIKASGFQQGASSPRFGGNKGKDKRSVRAEYILRKRALAEYALYRRQLIEDLEDFGYL